MSHDEETTTKPDAAHGDLAQLLSAVMRHPDTPEDIYNDLGDRLNDLFHEGLRVSDPWFVRRALRNAGAEGEGEREGEPDAEREGGPEGERQGAGRWPHEEVKRLTHEDAKALAEQVAFLAGDNQELAGDILVLVAYAEECGRNISSDAFTAVQNAFMPYLDASFNAANEFVCRRVDEWARGE